MKNVLFGPKEGWAPKIRETIDPERFRAVFHPFADRGLALEDFDCVVPLELKDYWPLRARPVNGRPNFLIPSEDVVALANDKCRMNEFLLRNGFEEFVPEIYNGQIAYPFIYKKSRDEWGLHSRIIYTPEEKDEFEAAVADEACFKQAYVAGKIEYITHIFAVEGQPRYVLTYEHGFDSDHYIKGKQAHYITHREVETPFMEVFTAILKKLNYTGTCCFNHKFSNGIPKIFEMNPRYGATLTLEVNAYLEAYLDALEERASVTGGFSQPSLEAAAPQSP